MNETVQEAFEDVDFSHFIYFFVDSKEEGQEITKKIAKDYNIKLMSARSTKRGNFKVKLALNREDVCDIACELSKLKKTLYIYEKEYLKSISEESNKYKDRLYRDIKYCYSRMIDDEGLSYDNIRAMINDMSFFENPLIKDSYTALKDIIPDDSMKALASKMLEKAEAIYSKNGDGAADSAVETPAVPSDDFCSNT